MRVVLDTNVFISGLISKPGSVTQRLRKAWVEGKFDVCISEYQIREIRRKLNTKFKDVTTPKERADLIGLIREACIVVAPKQKHNLSRDPDDSSLIDLAIEAKAQYMVTGDEDVLLVKHKGLKILTPSAFLKQLKRS